MFGDLAELLETAIYKEIESQALYSAAQKKTADPAALALMKDLEKQELIHSEELKKIQDQRQDKGSKANGWHQERVPDLMASDYLIGPASPEGAGLQDLLIFAMKREGQAVAFYSRMMGVMRDEDAKRLCESLVHWELSHKLRLELLYDNLFYGED